MTKSNIKRIDIHQVKSAMENKNKHCLIDIREPFEWQMIRIPGANLIPQNSLAEQLPEYLQDKEQDLYIYCRSGVRSLDVAAYLSGLGYERAYSLDGGIQAWAMAGYPVVEE